MSRAKRRWLSFVAIVGCGCGGPAQPPTSLPAPTSEPLTAAGEAAPEPEPPPPEPEPVAAFAEPTEPTELTEPVEPTPPLGATERVGPTQSTKPTGSTAARTGPSSGARQRGDAVAKKPTLIHNVVPAYPEEAKKAGLSGTVVVVLQLSDQGTVVNVRVISSTVAVFEAPAMDAAKRLLFRPARDKAGQPIAANVGFTFRFQLN